MVIPSSDRPQSSICAPRLSPPLAIEPSANCHLVPGAGTDFIILSAVGGRNALVTLQSAISSNAATGSNLGKRQATTGTPQYSAGNSTSSNPPIQAQSAGVHMHAFCCGTPPCDIATPGRWP